MLVHLSVFLSGHLLASRFTCLFMSVCISVLGYVRSSSRNVSGGRSHVSTSGSSSRGDKSSRGDIYIVMFAEVAAVVIVRGSRKATIS